MAELRPFCTEDRNALYEICLKTGDVGKDARHLYRDPELIGHIYVGPYAALSPEAVIVIEDKYGIGGYVAGAADTRAFETLCEAGWWPVLCGRYPLPKPDDTSQDAHCIRHFHSPACTPKAIARSHPAHLHINLLPRLQGQGWGRRLIDAWRAKMAELGASACHLVVGRANKNAVAFYRAYGFNEIATTATRIVFGMATK